VFRPAIWPDEKIILYNGLETFMTNDTAQKTITRIAEIIINELKLEDVTPETFDPDLDLVDEVGVDSMDLATVALVLRDEYGIRIDEDDYPKLTTVRIIAQYIDSKLTDGE
jgi:acyl carrier protein